MVNRSKWRLIPMLKACGKLQMAIDKWLYLQHQQGKHPPTLRFYTWSPPAISLGYHQKRFPDTWHNLTWKGEKIDLVTRPTGGRAVLHQGDLTYMVVTSGLKGDRLQVYSQICQFLRDGWRNLGVDLHYGQAGKGYIHNPSCFATSTGADLVTSEGSKLIGSAQLKKGQVILQHGTMILNPDEDLSSKVFGQVQKISGKFPSHAEIIEQLTLAASNCFNCDFFEKPLTNQELIEISSTYNKSSGCQFLLL